jgi:hypothetical protein
MDIIQLYQDFSVPFVTEGHKHSRTGWVNVECPWCEGNPGYHLGYELSSDHYYCWRCGWHPITPTVARLINKSEREVGKLIKEYGLRIHPIQKEELKPKKEHILPTGVMPLQSKHIEYLEARGFDYTRISKIWNIMGTGPVSRLDNIDFKHRIIIPIIWDGQEVSFTSRDVTGKTDLRYITCPKDRELIHHKHILYGRQEYWKETGILVEGPTDVWRMGTSSCATFGIKFTPFQVRALSSNFRRIAVCFDDDPQASIQTNKIVAELKFRGVDSFRVDIKGDPGSMKQEDADYLVKQLIK